MYDKSKIFEQAKEVVEFNQLIDVDEIPTYLQCARSTFYSYFPYGSDKLDTIKDLLAANKIRIKTKMRKKWYDSENATLQMALMKLLSTPEELRKLAMNYTDVTTDGKQIQFVINETRNYESDKEAD